MLHLASPATVLVYIVPPAYNSWPVYRWYFEDDVHEVVLPQYNIRNMVLCPDGQHAIILPKIDRKWHLIHLNTGATIFTYQLLLDIHTKPLVTAIYWAGPILCAQS